MKIGDDTDDIMVGRRGSQNSLGACKDAIHRLNQDPLIGFAAEGIDIPFPTQLKLSRLL